MAHPAQLLADRRHGQLFLEPCRQIAAPPAHHTVDLRIRAALYNRRPLRLVQVAGRTRSLPVLQTVSPFRVEAQHPVPDDLQPDTCKTRRIRTTMTVVNHRKRQKTAALRPIPAPLRKTKKTSPIKISTQRKGNSHDNPPIQGTHRDS